MTTLKTERLVLRRARPDDLDGIHAVLSDPRATAYWSTPPHDTLEQSRAWLETMIASPAEVAEDFIVEMDGRVIGKAGFYRLPEIGYILHPEVWGQGLASEAASAVLDHLFAMRPIDSVIADVDPDNEGSKRLLTKLGFQQTGTAKRTYLIADVWRDSVYYRLDRADWELRERP